MYGIAETARKSVRAMLLPYMPFSHFCRTTTRAALTPLGPHESWHGVPHGAVLNGTHPYPCNYSLYANVFSASRTRPQTQLHDATACPLIPRASELATACRQQAATAAKCKPLLEPSASRDCGQLHAVSMLLLLALRILAMQSL